MCRACLTLSPSERPSAADVQVRSLPLSKWEASQTPRTLHGPCSTPIRQQPNGSKSVLCFCRQLQATRKHADDILPNQCVFLCSSIW